MHGMAPGILVFDALIQRGFISGTVDLGDPDGTQGLVDGAVRHAAQEAHLAAGDVGRRVVPVGTSTYLTPDALPPDADLAPHRVDGRVDRLHEPDVERCPKITLSLSREEFLILV